MVNSYCTCCICARLCLLPDDRFQDQVDVNGPSRNVHSSTCALYTWTTRKVSIQKYVLKLWRLHVCWLLQKIVSMSISKITPSLACNISTSFTTWLYVHSTHFLQLSSNVLDSTKVTPSVLLSVSNSVAQNVLLHLHEQGNFCMQCYIQTKRVTNTGNIESGYGDRSVSMEIQRCPMSVI